MKNTISKNFTFPAFLLAGTMLIYSSCKKDDSSVVPDVTVASVKSGAKDLIVIPAADKVSLTSDLVIAFSKAVNPTTPSDFTLSSSSGATIPVTVTNAGATVTLNPNADLEKNTNYSLTIKATVKGTDGGPFVARIISFKTDNPAVDEVTITSVVSGATELTGALKENISLSDNFVITFSKAIIAPTSANFTLTPVSGAPAAGFSISITATTVTINPDKVLYSGSIYNLVINTGIAATDGGTFAGQTIPFKTDGPAYIVPPQATHQLAYFAFNGAVGSEVGTWSVANISSSYVAGRGGFANSAVAFNGTSDLIEVQNGSALFGISGTQSFWIKSDTNSGHGLFVMGMNFSNGSFFEMDQRNGWIKNGAGFATSNGTPVTEDLFFNGDGKYAGNGGWQGISFNTDNSASGGNRVLFSNWVHVVHTYDAVTKLRTLYLNGTKMMQADFNGWPVGDIKQTVAKQFPQITPTPDNSNVFAFGFGRDRSATLYSTESWGDYNQPTSNHFKGILDDVRFFDVALTTEEVTALYNAEK